MKKGFTLIELLVTATIMSIIAGGSTASYIRFNQKEKLKNAALMVKTYLRKAQTKAMVGEKSCLSSDESASERGCGGTDAVCGNEPSGEQSLDGWCLDMYRGYLYGHCGGPVGTVPEPVDFNPEEFSLPEDVLISFYAPDGTQDKQRAILMFKPLGQGVDKASVICLTSSNLGVTSRYKLSITTSGEINDDGFVQSCP